MVDVRNPSLIANGPKTWRLPAFAVLVDDVKNPSLATEGPETWHLLTFTVIVTNDVEIQA